MPNYFAEIQYTAKRDTKVQKNLKCVKIKTPQIAKIRPPCQSLEKEENKEGANFSIAFTRSVRKPRLPHRLLTPFGCKH